MRGNRIVSLWRLTFSRSVMAIKPEQGGQDLEMRLIMGNTQLPHA